MAIADNGYSRFVRYAKIGLPILALALLSTMFLFSRNFDPSAAIPFAEVDVEKIAREQRLASPRFSGLTSDGSTVLVEADSARPDLTDPRKLSANNVSAEIVTVHGRQYNITAKDALYDGQQDRLDLVGDVRITTSTGYTLQSDKLEARLDETGLRSPGPVQGTSPTGSLEAGEMELMTADGTQVLVFKNGVKLIYQRQPQGGE